ncbi:acyl-CoA N-acyltransferase [Microthyrium microscopicum]|uniref:Acyl-CoA N-acyltransferase n=1 Tax=Microthyrium microscopicum TaxID=703497 RepID=A0A6A6U340_9PEZI|nr:acyl-CoA N-acyltransferase [Microthyrium microscopicum]
MAIIIEPATSEEDLLEFARIHLAEGNRQRAYEWNAAPSEASIRNIAKGNVSRLSNPAVRMMKAVDTEAGNKVVGAAIWLFPVSAELASQAPVATVSLVGIPEQNHEAKAELIKMIEAGRKEIMGTREHVYLASIAVRPDAQRQGIGKKLTEWGIDEAQRLELPIYLDATPQGKGLYEKFQFELIEEVAFDPTKYGGTEPVLCSRMLKEAQTVQK